MDVEVIGIGWWRRQDGECVFGFQRLQRQLMLVLLLGGRVMVIFRDSVLGVQQLMLLGGRAVEVVHGGVCGGIGVQCA